jgi:hypothetical protein
MLSRLWINILRAILLGLTYGYLEVHISVTLPTLVYRVVYILLLTLPFVNSNLWIWFADGLLAQATQDSSFWLFKGQLPYSWAWYYPVWHHIPLDDVIASIVIVILYSKGKNYNIQQKFI